MPRPKSESVMVSCPFCKGAADKQLDGVAGCNNKDCNVQPSIVAVDEPAAVVLWNTLARATAQLLDETMPDDLPASFTNTLDLPDVNTSTSDPAVVLPATPGGEVAEPDAED